MISGVYNTTCCSFWEDILWSQVIVLKSILRLKWLFSMFPRCNLQSITSLWQNNWKASFI
jgi:hypothetical protein